MSTQIEMTQPLVKGMPTLRGDRFRRSLSASVFGILGKDTRPISSRGTRFYNKDRWTGRILTFHMCKWAAANPGCVPTKADVAVWVAAANATKEPRPEIVIAAVPDTLPLRISLALTGGVYHEAFHTLFSCRRDLKVDEVASIVLPRWAQVPDWSKLHKTMQSWTNLIEDVRIERRGRERFPGVEVKLHDLQDYILDQENAGRPDTKSHAAPKSGKAKPTMNALSAVACTFRDVGLGYVTTAGKIAMAKYRESNADAVALVLEGPLAPLLHETIALSATDDLGCLRLAMDVLIILVEKSQQKPEESDDEGDSDEDSQEGQSGNQQSCPGCDAPPWKLIVRPKADGKGGKVPNKGICTCTVCGWQMEVDVSEAKPAKGQKAPSTPGPKFEGFDPKEPDEGSDSDGESSDSDGKSGSESKSGKGKGKSSKDKSKPDAKGKGDKSDKGDNAEQNEGDDKATGDKADDKAESDEETGDEDEAKDTKGKSEGGESNEDESDDESGESDGDAAQASGQGDKAAEPGSATAPTSYTPGGVSPSSEDPHQGTDWTGILQAMLTEATSGQTDDLKDGSEVLQAAIDKENAKEDKDTQKGEKVWRPFAPEQDEILVVQPSTRGRDYDTAQARALADSVAAESSCLRARLRTIIRAMEMTQDQHGLRRGPNLSERFLIDSKIAMIGGQMPDRAFYQKDIAPDTSLAACIVIDESYSMIEGSKLRDATRAMVAITEPLDALGCAVQVAGFRDGTYGSGQEMTSADKPQDYHRGHKIIHDVFKTFGERFAAVKWRFANTRASGGTPMSDGMQFALDALSPRKEGHRIMFVITDGQPNGDHVPIMERQFRLAKEVGIHIIGVGLGHDSRYVQTTFPDHVWTANVADMPKALIAKLNDLLADARMKARRGMTVQKQA